MVSIKDEKASKLCALLLRPLWVGGYTNSPLLSTLAGLVFYYNKFLEKQKVCNLECVSQSDLGMSFCLVFVIGICAFSLSACCLHFTRNVSKKTERTIQRNVGTRLWIVGPAAVYKLPPARERRLAVRESDRIGLEELACKKYTTKSFCTLRA